MNTGTTYTKVYEGPTSRVSHEVPDSSGISGLAHIKAMCGKFPPLIWGWLGTGNQEEYDKAASLPLCRRCRRLKEQREEAESAVPRRDAATDHYLQISRTQEDAIGT